MKPIDSLIVAVVVVVGFVIFTSLMTGEKISAIHDPLGKNWRRSDGWGGILIMSGIFWVLIMIITAGD